MKFDVVIPYHPKDRDILPWNIQGIRANIAEASNILVVSRKSEREFVEKLGVGFIDEDEIVPGIRLSSFPEARWGWYFQQILKLGIADIIEPEYYLVIDADTIFLKPTSFFNDKGKPLYATIKASYPPAFEIIEKLLGISGKYEESFIVHHTVFSKSIVQKLRKQLAGKNLWYSCILDCKANNIFFAENETYPYFLKTHYPNEMEIRPLKYSDIDTFPTASFLRRLATYYDYCSFHAYLRGNSPSWIHHARVRIKYERRFIKYRLQSLISPSS